MTMHRDMPLKMCISNEVMAMTGVALSLGKTGARFGSLSRSDRIVFETLCEVAEYFLFFGRLGLAMIAHHGSGRRPQTPSAAPVGCGAAPNEGRAAGPKEMQLVCLSRVGGC